MTLVVWSIMFVFYIVFFSLMALVAAGYLIAFLVRQRRFKAKAAPGIPFSHGARPAYG